MDSWEWERFDCKWQEKWEKDGAYRAEPQEGRQKKFVTAAFPYPNSPQHIGHGRTYTVADVYARYLRMKGYNVLFPMAFHVTGTPIVSMAKKIRENDREMLDVFERIYGISREQAARLVEPKELVLYFSREIELGMKEMGFAIDWRRKFYTFDAHFNRFVEWQFRKLKQLGYLKTGQHPVPWCPEDDNAVSAHDTKGDADPEVEEVSALKFAFLDGSIIVSTYRPETLFGVTNLWVNPDAQYVKARWRGEVLYLAREAADSLGRQLELKVEGTMRGSELVGKKARSPLGKEVEVLPASFVEPAEGTGAVMSVPAHAPYDYLALRDLGKIGELGLPVIIALKGYVVPAKEVVERMGVKNQDDPLAEEATKEVYKKEVHEGRMAGCGPEYDGLPVGRAREKIKDALEKNKGAMALHIIANGPVFCRCGARIIVNIVKDQWFIDYGDAEWKAKAKECLSGMRLLPERTRDEYLYTVDWLKAKACVRAHGLGTPFPFQPSQIIESLSDSTIYMAFYTIAHLLEGVDPAALDEKFFDYVFFSPLGSEQRVPPAVKNATEMRKSFMYWYPVDSRHSGADLVRNHLPFFVFNHAALFQKERWPRQIVANGFVLMDGKKMSKSMGNILPLRAALAQYGADVVRVSMVGGADLSVDTDFSRTVAQGVESRFRSIFALGKYADKEARGQIDYWLLSRMHRRIAGLDQKYSDFQFREVVKELVYESSADLSWYMKRAKEPRLREFFLLWARAIAPLAPHTAEEIWSRVGGEGFVIDQQLPAAESGMVNERLEIAEGIVVSLIEDVKRIAELTGMKPKKASVFLAAGWKHKAYGIAREARNFESAMKKCMEEEDIKKHGADAARFLKQIGKNIFSLPNVLGEREEMAALLDAGEFLQNEMGLEIRVQSETGSAHPKAKNAMPGKPAIVLE